MNHLNDHQGIREHYRARSPRAEVFPPLVLHPCAGDVRFYERTAHIRDSSQRFAAAVSLRYTMAGFHVEPIMGGDVWFKPRLTGQGEP